MWVQTHRSLVAAFGMVVVGSIHSAYPATPDHAPDADCIYTQQEEETLGLTADAADRCDRSRQNGIDDFLAAHADLPEAHAFFLLGQALEEGSGIAQDPVLSMRYYKRAADLEHAEAQHAFGILMLNIVQSNEMKERGLYWLGRAAGNGHALSALVLGHLRETGQFGVSIDWCAALAWYETGQILGMVNAKRFIQRILNKRLCGD